MEKYNSVVFSGNLAEAPVGFATNLLASFPRGMLLNSEKLARH